MTAVLPKRARRLRAAVAGSLLVVAIACGSTGSETDGVAGPGDGTSGATSSSGASSSSGGFNTDSSLPDASSSSTGGFPFDGGLACAKESHQGKLAPLDLVLMQDTSDSMFQYASEPTTKWTAIKNALASFMTDPGSAGMALGVQFFPIFAQGVPNSCTTKADCGPYGGDCVLKRCAKSTSACTTDTDCKGAGGGSCLPLQRCQANQQYTCLTDTDCSGKGLSPATCNQPLGPSICSLEAIDCNQDYSSLAVPMATLPGAASAINAAIDARIPNGSTPTYRALQGAIDAAKARKGARPDAVVAVVLSTDGVPTSCGPSGNPALAPGEVPPLAYAAAHPTDPRTPSIKTFVIGVLSPQDSAAAANLNAVAESGGTKTAWIVNTSATTQADFIVALNKIRGQTLPSCDLSIPVPEAGTPDYNMLNVIYVDPDTQGQMLMKYVAADANCNATTGGWYYDVPPGGAATPSKLTLCPASCQLAQSKFGGIVNVVLGCETEKDPILK